MHRALLTYSLHQMQFIISRKEQERREQIQRGFLYKDRISANVTPAYIGRISLQLRARRPLQHDTASLETHASLLFAPLTKPR